MSASNDDGSKSQIELWRIKNLIKSLDNAKGNGTSMISLIIPPKDQISRVSRMLVEEYGTATQIKNRVNRLSVLSAITSTQQKLKLYNKVPPNGLIVYCGTVISDDGKDKLVNIDLEPFKPINTKLYLCDNKFHTEALKDLLASDETFGFVVMDGNGTLFGTLTGNTRKVLHKLSVDLPKKHGRGGQSSVRFARLRVEKRHNYVRKIAELCTQLFITDNKPNVSGLVLAGLAAFKNELAGSDLFDPRLKKCIVKIVDISYGGAQGFNQAIELSKEALGDVKFIKEKQLLQEYFVSIKKDTGRYVYGIKDTLECLEAGAIETLIVWENLDVTRYTLRNNSTGDQSEVNLTSEQAENKENFKDKKAGTELEIVKTEPLIEWFASNYQNWGAELQFISDRSQEGSQFVKGFGGIGALLRYRPEFLDMDLSFSDDDSDDDYFI